MRIRTTSIGLPKTYARITRKRRGSAGLFCPLSRPLSKPVSVLGEFMLGLLTHEHEKRNPTTVVMSADYGPGGSAMARLQHGTR